MTAHDGQGDDEIDGIEGHDTKSRANKAPVKATLFAQPAVGLRAVALNKNITAQSRWQQNTLVISGFSVSLQLFSILVFINASQK